jgi:alpha-beta hydrolase superfamily lysophospholipase
MSETSFELTAADGLRLQGYRWAPEGTPRAIVQIAHGMSEHAGRYADLATRLAAKGYLAVAHDHRGHGKSIRPGDEPGHMADENGWSKAVDDLHRVGRHAAAEHPRLPLVLFGHSMGSFMSQQLSFTYPDDIAALALSASNGKPPPIALAGRGIARVERMRLGKRGKSKLMDKLSFQDFNSHFRPTRTPFDWISRDEKAVDEYTQDAMCGFMCTVQTWIDLLDALPALTRPENLARIRKDLPIYCFSGDCDPVGLMGKGLLRLIDAYKSAGLCDVEYKLYEGARHELLHETNREEAITGLLSWLDRVVSKAAAAA